MLGVLGMKFSLRAPRENRHRLMTSAILRRRRRPFCVFWEDFLMLTSLALILLVGLGAAADIRYTLRAGPGAVGMILLALCFRAAGELLCLVKTPLRARERLFCVLAYLPKATVQAAIGSVPLSLGLPCGDMVLSTAVLGILITAPLGAFAIDWGAPRLLTQEKEPS